MAITVKPSISEEDTIILSTESMGVTNSIYIHSYKAEINLSDWYGRRSLEEANTGIDQLIELLTAAKAEIAKRLEQPDPTPTTPEPPTDVNANDLSWLMSETPAPRLATYHALINHLIYDIDLNDEKSFDLTIKNIRAERFRLLSEGK